jgi:hypothetical protein
MDLNKNNFWSKKTYTLPVEVDYMYERLQKSKDYTIIQKVLGSTFPGANQDVSYFDILKEKVITAQTVSISETQNRTKQLNSLLKEAKGEGALSSDDDLSDEAIAIQEQINFQSQIKFLQMYFDAYMAPKVSDVEWRLGKVTGTVLNTDMPSTGQINGGLMYTRSAFSFPFYRQYWDYGFTPGNAKNNFKDIFDSIEKIKNSIDKIEEISNYSGPISGIVYNTVSETVTGTISGIVKGVASGIVSGLFSGMVSGLIYGTTSGIGDGIISGYATGQASGILYTTNSSGVISGLFEKTIGGIVSGISTGSISGNSSGVISGIVSGILYGSTSSIVSGILSSEVSATVEGTISGFFSNTVAGKISLSVEGPGYGQFSKYITGLLSTLKVSSAQFYSSGVLSGYVSGIITGNSKGPISGIATGIISGIADDNIFDLDKFNRPTNKKSIISGYASELVYGTASGKTQDLSTKNLSGIFSNKNYGEISGYISGVVSGVISTAVSKTVTGKIYINPNINTAINNLISGISELNYHSNRAQGLVPGVLADISGYLQEISGKGFDLENINLESDDAIVSITTNISSIKPHFNNFMAGITTNIQNPEIFLDEALFGLTGIKQKREYYSTLFFPPYKISPKNGIGDFTQYMNDIYSTNPEASFDIDSFFLRKEGFTYRDPGFKSLSDYINYLQWIIEGATGVVHTYLTEWDLSLYMQENLLSATTSGAPLKLYLNYRIRQDNPLASDEALLVSTGNAGGNTSAAMSNSGSAASAGKYTDDRALVFNVAGSAVSKIDFDNFKLWRPSDFPLSVWWMPYLRGRDWEMKEFVAKDYMMEKHIPYMDIYDTVSSEFAYDNSSLKDIFKNQDYLGSIMGIWPNWGMKYFTAFYSSPLDGHSDFDIKVYGDLQKVAGADYGMATAQGKGLDDFISIAKKEMLLNEGYYGTISSIAGQGTRYDYVDDGSSSDEKMTMSSMKSKQKAGKDAALADVDLNQPFASGKGKAQDMMASGLNNKVDASSMTNFTGMNRFAPALFGGPHGSEYNPNTIQAYFDVNSQLLRNIARIDPSQAKNEAGIAFKSENNEDYYEGLNSLYDDGTKTGISPAKGLKNLIHGVTAYTINYAYQEVEKTRIWIRVPSFDSYPSHTQQGYEIIWYTPDDQRLATSEDKSIIRTFTSEDEVPASYNGEQIGQYRNGKYYVETIIYEKLADYKELQILPYKQYLLHDEPNVSWEIIQHKFEEYTAENSKSGSFWRNVNEIFKNTIDNKLTDYKKELNRITQQFKPVFVLKFFKPDRTQDIDVELKMREILVERHSHNKPRPIFFLEGNESERTDTGPESIFRADCKVEYYKDVQDHYEETSLFGFIKKKKKIGEFYNYVPFIKVDIPNSDLIADDLQFKGYSNKNETGLQTPMHLNSTMWTDRDSRLHILQKFKATNAINVMTSYRSSKTIEKDMTASLLVAVLVVAAVVVAPGLLVAAPGLLAGVAAVSVGLALKEEADAKKEADKGFDFGSAENHDVNWVSSSYLILSGIGMLSQIQGLDPEAVNIRASSEASAGLVTNYNYRDLLKVMGNLYDTPFKEITFKTHKYISEDDPLGYTEENMDGGLQKALLNLYLRPRFLIQKDSSSSSYCFTPLDTPIRNFLSILLTQVSYYKFIKSSLIGESESESLVDFNTLYKTLTMCVDKCILKASGLNGLNERVEPDRSHIYYDYWIEQIIKILDGPDIARQEKRTLIKNELQRKIDIIQATIDELHPMCLKNIDNWTLNEVLTALNLIATIKTLDKVGNLEKFLFGYLRILYYYRFFFIAKRFNKENGTMWIMRALESTLEFIVPTAPSSGPPPSPSEMTKKEPIYNVAFFEIQNTTYAKQQAIINQESLDPDRITKIYIRVQWCEKADYDRYISDTEKYDEVIELEKEGIKKYAFKPIDGTYTLISKEYLENDKNIKWNNLHQLETQRNIKDFDTAQWFITWEDSPNSTPIRWDVFGEINVDNLLQYAKESISPDEYMCLIEQGADFWTVSIPDSMQPRAEGFRTKIKIKQYTPINPEQLGYDPMINITGPMAYTMYPITQKQERPYPGVSSDNPTMFKLGNEGLGGF